jgi:hypothetical protein
MAINRRALFALLVVAALVIYFFYPSCRSSTSYFTSGVGGADLPISKSDGLGSAPVGGMSGPAFDVSGAGLIPREVTATEDFGQFSPANILSGQNYLDARSQIGYPETIGGVLRNANRQFRSEPINPRDPVSIWNLSTIPPDTMRPRFEISPEYQ